MSEQLRIFFAALSFYTRLPCPGSFDHGSNYLSRATRYFPLIGAIIGGFGALFLFILAQALPILLAVLGACAATVWFTGAFHEDGFGDMCDAFGGGMTRERVLDIMKDSRLGSYAVVGLAFLLALKIAALYHLAEQGVGLAALALVTGHTISRSLAAATIYILPYTRKDATSKITAATKAPRKSELFWVIFWVLPAVAALTIAHPVAPAALILVVAAWFYMLRLCHRRLGGYTGDCLGAIQQVTEPALYIGLCAVFAGPL
ncbi:MAG: adenosylcobinamide-GDP ribazoletransferase [Opitutales bacterium]